MYGEAQGVVCVGAVSGEELESRKGTGEEGDGLSVWE